MQFSETPFLLASKSIIDPSTFDESYKQGQAIRQAYDARLHQKAMNELMKLPDYNTRLQAAQSSEYAGALVPMVQKYEEDRKKAAMANLKDSADIAKTFSESGKLGAETGKIGAETQNTIFSQLIPALANDPFNFARNIDALGENGTLNPNQVASYKQILTLPIDKQVQAFGAIMKANPDVAKAMLPQLKDMDLGGSRQLVSFDPQTGQVTDGGNYAVSVDPTKQYVADKGYQGDVYRADKGYQGDVYKSDKGYQGTVYSTDGRTQVAKLDNNGRLQIAWANNKSDETIAGMKANSAGTGGTNPAAAKPMPIGAVKEQAENQSQLNNAAKNLRQIANWRKRIANGEIEFSAVNNGRDWLSNKTGIQSLGKNPQAYAEYKAFITSMASELLRMNKGVQTDMDYKRQLEAVQAGDYLPRNNQTAVTLLNRMMNDYQAASQTAFQNSRALLNNYGRGGNLGSYPSATNAPKKQTSNPNVTTSKVADLWQ